MAKKMVYVFGGSKADGKAEMKELLGGKGANLAEMSRLGISVPPGFTISTEVCTHFMKKSGKYPAELKSQVKGAVAKVEKLMGLRFADPDDPLLISVRSGARISMPGMMETVLNIGLSAKKRAKELDVDLGRSFEETVEKARTGKFMEDFEK